MEIGKGKKTRRAFGFDEIALVPGLRTLDPELPDTTVTIGGIKLDFPIIASAMDSVISPRTAVLMGKYGGLGVLNLQGVQTRYKDADKILEEIASVTKDKYVELMQRLYLEPVKPELVRQRIKEIKQHNVPVAVSVSPAAAEELGEIAVKVGADILFIQVTVTSTQHISKNYKLNLKQFCAKSKIPVAIGNCVTYEVTTQLMEAGAAAVLVGIGPGAACTSRGVLGVGMPMATAIADCAAARDDFKKKTKKYIPIISDGGMVVGGDICKSIACGADAVMIGSPIAKAKEAPGRGYHWVRAPPNATLPRGARINVGTIGTLKEILLGPAKYDDGSENLVSALKTSMATLGAANLKEMQKVAVVIAPSMLTEGKVFQKAQALGMYK